MTSSRPLILRLSRPREHPHLKWQRNASSPSRKSERTSSNKASATRELIATLATSTSELSDSEINDSLGTYLSMLEQHRVIADSRTRQEPDDPEAEEISPLGSKRAASPGRQIERGRNKGRMTQNFPGSSGNSCQTPNSERVSRSSSSFSQEIPNSPNRQSSTRYRHLGEFCCCQRQPRSRAIGRNGSQVRNHQTRQAGQDVGGLVHCLGELLKGGSVCIPTPTGRI